MIRTTRLYPTTTNRFPLVWKPVHLLSQYRLDFLPSPGRCAQSSFRVIHKISFTSWRTNCFHSPQSLIHQIAVLLSRHWREPLISISSFKAFYTVAISFANTLPDFNSSLGIACVFSGATLVLDVSRVQGRIQKIQKEGAESPTLPLQIKTSLFRTCSIQHCERIRHAK